MNYEVASFWHGSPLSFVERACIQSFLDHGYKFHLYSLDSHLDVPDGVILHDARSIFADPEFEAMPGSRKRAAIYSDVFRIHMMQKTDYVWVDVDVYCVRPLEIEPEYMFGTIRRKGAINNCVLRLPKQSLALKMIANFYASEVPLPFWLSRDKVEALVQKYEQTGKLTLYDLPWTTTGPSVAIWALNTTGEISRGQHWHLYFPHTGFLDPERDVAEYEQDWVRLQHFQGWTRADIVNKHGGIPPRGSYVDFVCQRHQIDPQDYPILL